MMTDLHQFSIRQLSEGLAAKQFSSVELTRHYLQRIHALDRQVNSFITVTSDLALAQAQAADAARAAGQATPLTGIPLAHKDIFCTQGVLTTAGSKMLGDASNPFIAPYNATVVEKCQQAGMVTLGKVNMDEFAMGSTSETSYFGATRNPWSLERVAGGSSGGSAAVVAADLAPLATGTDTGGSIRQPAALCGLTGLKPSYGRVSRFGMIAYASSLDQAGPMGRSAEDCAYLLQAMAGHDPRDSTSAVQPVADYVAALSTTSVQGLRIGIPREYFDPAGTPDNMNPAVRQCLLNALAELKAQGALLVDIELPRTAFAVPTYYVIAPAEASSNLSRYDGVRFGYRCNNPQDLTDLYKRSRSEGFGDEVKRRILIGTYALSAGYYDAYYVKAQKVRRLIQQDFLSAFEQVDVIAAPVTADTAYRIGARLSPAVTYLEDIYTLPVNLAGLPAISFPCGLVERTVDYLVDTPCVPQGHATGNVAKGACAPVTLPVGIQLIGNYWSEHQLLAIAHHYQQHTDWHLQRSPLARQALDKE